MRTALAAAAGAMALAGCATTDGDPPRSGGEAWSQSEVGLIQAFEAGYGDLDAKGEASLVAVGYDVCAELQRGVTREAVARPIREQGFGAARTEALIDFAVQSMCPTAEADSVALDASITAEVIGKPAFDGVTTRVPLRLTNEGGTPTNGGTVTVQARDAAGAVLAEETVFLGHLGAGETVTKDANFIAVELPADVSFATEVDAF